MSCVALNAFDVSMATTQLTCAACYEALQPWVHEQGMVGRRLHMNWVVVTDGRTQLRMQWNVAGDD